MGPSTNPEKYEGEGLFCHRTLFRVRVGSSATPLSAAAIGLAAPQRNYRDCRGREARLAAESRQAANAHHEGALGLVSAGYGAILLRRRRPVTARQTAARAMINHHSSAGLTTTTHATRCALCVVRTLPEPPGGCGLISPCGRRSRRGVLGSSWGRLAARRAGGQRRRRRRGDFGLNSGIFSINNIRSRYCRFS